MPSPIKKIEMCPGGSEKQEQNEAVCIGILANNELSGLSLL